jgi:hypothetical protein
MLDEQNIDVCEGVVFRVMLAKPLDEREVFRWGVRNFLFVEYL